MVCGPRLLISTEASLLQSAVNMTTKHLMRYITREGVAGRKPLIKDTLKENKPSNKGHARSTHSVETAGPEGVLIKK